MLRARTPRPAMVAAVAIGAVAAIVLSWLKQHTSVIDHVGAMIGIIENPKAAPATLFSDWFNYISPYPRVLEFLTGVALAHAHMLLARHSVRANEARVARMVLAVAVFDIALFVLRNELGGKRQTEAVLTIRT
jgi:hypothetical protein